MTRQPEILRAQLRAAIAIGDRAAELILGSRLTPTLCRAPGCQRQRRPDSPWCESCFRAVAS